MNMKIVMFNNKITNYFLIFQDATGNLFHGPFQNCALPLDDSQHLQECKLKTKCNQQATDWFHAFRRKGCQGEKTTPETEQNRSVRCRKLVQKPQSTDNAMTQIERQVQRLENIKKGPAYSDVTRQNRSICL